MSDRERSASRNGSRERAPPAKKATRGHSRSRSRSPPPAKSRKYASPERYSRSRSRSASAGAAGGGRRGSYRRYSRSRSRSYTTRDSYRRSRSHSPMSARRRHLGDRENPSVSRCLGVFGLSLYTSEQQINHIFSKYGPVEKTQVVIDAKTGRSRGFCFVYFESTEDAKVAKNECSGMEIDGRRIRVDYSITARPHTPTPGIYMGKPTYISRENGYDRRRDRDDYYGGRGGGGGYRERERERDYYHRGYRHRSPSPHYRRARRYDRDRSYSPRRY